MTETRSISSNSFPYAHDQKITLTIDHHTSDQKACFHMGNASTNPYQQNMAVLKKYDTFPEPTPFGPHGVPVFIQSEISLFDSILGNIPMFEDDEDDLLAVLDPLLCQLKDNTSTVNDINEDTFMITGSQTATRTQTLQPSGPVSKRRCLNTSKTMKNITEKMHTGAPNTNEGDTMCSRGLAPSASSLVCCFNTKKRKSISESSEMEKWNSSSQERTSHLSFSTTSSVEDTITSSSEDDDESSSFADGGKTSRCQIESWNKRFQDLLHFKEKHGHCLVPHKFSSKPRLAQWVKRQRYQYKLKQQYQHSTLTDERETMLEMVGFIWDSHKAVWDERYEMMKKFKEVHGHCNVPANYVDHSLAVWVKCQRRQYKLYQQGSKSTITQERFARMEALGFTWNPRNL